VREALSIGMDESLRLAIGKENTMRNFLEERNLRENSSRLSLAWGWAECRSGWPDQPTGFSAERATNARDVGYSTTNAGLVEKHMPEMISYRLNWLKLQASGGGHASGEHARPARLTVTHHQLSEAERYGTVRDGCCWQIRTSAPWRWLQHHSQDSNQWRCLLPPITGHHVLRSRLKVLIV